MMRRLFHLFQLEVLLKMVVWFEYQCINSNIMVERELVCSYDTTHNPDLVYPSRMKAGTPNKCQGCLF